LSSHKVNNSIILQFSFTYTRFLYSFPKCYE